MDRNTRQLIADVIQQDIGFPAHLKGSYYLEEAVTLLLENESMPIMQVYQTMAKFHSRNPANIEHNIQYTVKYAFEVEQIEYTFSLMPGKPSNSEVIWTIVECVKRHLLRKKMHRNIANRAFEENRKDNNL